LPRSTTQPLQVDTGFSCWPVVMQ